jgi:hypothetical protein
MIPYDDLVVALATWRARQGLPVATLSGALTPPPAAVVPPGPKSAPRAVPPAPPAASAPLASDEEIDGSSLLDEQHYENEGNDFAMAFGQPEHDEESTSIGVGPPMRDTTDDMPPPPPARRKR